MVGMESRCILKGPCLVYSQQANLVENLRGGESFDFQSRQLQKMAAWLFFDDYEAMLKLEEMELVCLKIPKRHHLGPSTTNINKHLRSYVVLRTSETSWIAWWWTPPRNVFAQGNKKEVLIIAWWFHLGLFPLPSTSSPPGLLHV